MGGPRAKTDRMRWAGQMCCNCHRLLPEPQTPSEKFCPVCRPKHRVLMCFEWRAGRWEVVYRELNVWPFPRTNRFSSPNRLRELFDRFGVFQQPVNREQFEFCLQTGRGMVELELTSEQLSRLKEDAESKIV